MSAAYNFNILSAKVDISLQILAMLINFEVVLTLISLYIEKFLLPFWHNNQNKHVPHVRSIGQIYNKI